MEYDVLIASDFRFPGGTSHSIAEEVRAQSRLGYSTGLLHLNGPLIRKVTPFNSLIQERLRSGEATLVVGPEPVRTELLVVRHPAVLQHTHSTLPPIAAEKVVIIANAGPNDIDGHRHYSVEDVNEAARRHFEVEPVWAPIGPLVRREIERHVAPSQMAERDWVNIIDVDAWHRTRTDWRGARPVVGRHSRPSPQKWPEDARTLRMVYPTTGEWDVRVLGGAEPARALLGSLPSAWRVRPFGAIDPADFLEELDFFVYYHDSRWVEAFGRTILEAIASGLPAVLPPHFSELFGESALYAKPESVRELVEGLRSDRSRYVAHVQRASDYVRAHFGYEAHGDRLKSLIGPPRPGQEAEPKPQTDLSPVQRTTTERRPTVLFMSSNGSGMGHLTRLLAYARRIDGRAKPYFLSMSQAAPVVARFGFPYEYLPSATTIAMPPGEWQHMFVDRVVDALDRVRPDVVVFDGTWPYNGIPAIREKRPDVRWVWSRRGMWRRGANVDQLSKSEWFDLVIEPGDFAAANDRGSTTDAVASKVGPVTLLDAVEADDRGSAREALGLPAQGPLALLSLGAGNIDDTSDNIGRTATALSELGIGVCVTQPEIARSTSHGTDVHLIRDYPLARRYAAFDLVVSAAGYNSFQELMRMGLPSLFVPNQATALDDQEARATYAAERGWAHMLKEVTIESALPLLRDLRERGQSMAALAASTDPGNGAQKAADEIHSLTIGRKPEDP